MGLTSLLRYSKINPMQNFGLASQGSIKHILPVFIYLFIYLFSLRWPRNTLYPQKLALTSPTSGGRSVGIVRLRTKATEFSYF
jgi:hypothetical protein